MSHNYYSNAVETKDEAERQYPFYLNAACSLNIGYPSSNYPNKLVLFCTGFEFNPLTAPYIALQIGKNEISNFKLNSSLLYNQDGQYKYNYFWFGQFTLSVLGTEYNSTIGANATLNCVNLTICNQNDYCIDNIQNTVSV